MQLRDTVSSGGTDPVSIAIHDDLVYVANASATSPNFTGFRLGWFGQLCAIPGSTVGLPAGSQPGDVLLNWTGSTLAGTGRELADRQLRVDPTAD